MLPSFRLIAATFLCGFVVVFAGLRMAASLNDIHEGLPVMAAHAAPVSIAPDADHELRRSVAAAPMMYDLRFAVSRTTLAPTLVTATPLALDRPAPPMSLLPPEDFIRGITAPAATEAAPTEPDSTIAAIPQAAPVTEPSAATVPDPDAAAEPSKPDVATDQTGDRQP